MECVSEELSETMYDPFGVVGFVFYSYSHHSLYSMHAVNHFVRCFENTSIATELAL